jgi:motility quorum-sensing regulator/GCU-specific mRNA interferase toxin
MEKKKAHYALATIQYAIKQTSLRRITVSAMQGAFALGMDEQDIVEAVCGLNSKDLHKSMTVNVDNTIWQDVYRTKYKEFELYIKLQLVDKAVVISFKEL